MDKKRNLREKINSTGTFIIAGAHNGISAKLAEEAGFDGIWASGFEISASHGVPDANILTMEENLAVAIQINKATCIPVIADCDNGYGNAINVIRMVEQYENAGIAGVCIEDNLFPKRCSFYAGVKRELESAEEFSGKIKAAVETRKNNNFIIIARTEALIAGWGMEEALLRGRAYADAGADMVLIHSKSESADEVKDFAAKWDRGAPLVAVPTIYKNTSVDELEKAGFKMVIFANHGMRASIKAMRNVFGVLRNTKTLSSIDEEIVPLEDVYELVGVQKMKEQEKKYLPVGAQKVSAILLAAGFDEHLLPLVEQCPKAMLDIKGKSILERQVEILNDVNIKDISVVRGYKKESINLPNLHYVDNDEFSNTYILDSLFCAENVMKGRFVFIYADIVFEKSIIEKLLQCDGDVCVVVDRSWNDQRPPIEKPDLVVSSDGQRNGHRFISAKKVNDQVLKIGNQINHEKANGEFVGMAMFSEKGTAGLKQIYHDCKEKYKGKPFHEANSFETASLTDILQELIDRGVELTCVDVYKGWLDINTFEDYKRAWAEIH